MTYRTWAAAAVLAAAATVITLPVFGLVWWHPLLTLGTLVCAGRWLTGRPCLPADRTWQITADELTEAGGRR